MDWASAYLGIRALLTTYPSTNPMLLGGYGYYGYGGIPRIGEHAASVSIDWRVLTFTIAISLVASTVAGLFPALQILRVDLQHALKQTGGGSGTGVRHKSVRGALVVTEIALALVLLVGAGLLIRTSLALRAVNPGFDTHHVLTMRMSVSGTPFERRDGIARLTREGLEQIRAVTRSHGGEHDMLCAPRNGLAAGFCRARPSARQARSTPLPVGPSCHLGTSTCSASRSCAAGTSPNETTQGRLAW